MELDQKALALFTEGYTKILEGIGHLGYDVKDDNFEDTAARAAKGLHELIHDQAPEARDLTGGGAGPFMSSRNR